MPNIFIKIPKDAFSGEHRAVLIKEINAAAIAAEQIPNDLAKQMTCWVIVEEINAESWSCGTIEMTSRILPCVAIVYVPAGVLNGASRTMYSDRIHSAFKQALPATEGRRLATSVILHDVIDGTWAANGIIWHLPDFAQAAGYGHLQSLNPVRG